MSAASLWAAVPHYVAAVPNPKAGLALLRRLEGMIGIAVEAPSSRRRRPPSSSRSTQAVAANPEIEELVERLEEQQDEVAGFDRRTSRRATRSPRSSSASCASRATSNHPSGEILGFAVRSPRTRWAPLDAEACKRRSVGGVWVDIDRNSRPMHAGD